MYRHGFVEKDIDPSDVHEKVKEFLVNDGFNITSDEHHDQMWEIHAKKSGRERIVLGKVRDVDVVIAGSKGKFEVQLHAGIWGRDMAVPAVEGLLTLGLATAVEVHEGHEYELNLWKRIVHLIDPSLLVCDLDGLLFKSRDDLEKHIKMAHQQNNTGMMMAPMMMAGMGLMTMGMFGGFGGFGPGFGGFWI